MAKAKEPGRSKLLDIWSAPRGAGAPIGCVATSYTFSTEFFEEECLSRFLKMETDAKEDDILYFIDREEKLSQIECAAVLVDQAHSNGLRSPRWDLVPIRVVKGVQHSKVTILYWQNWVRVIVSSANLSPQGYRLNEEVVSILDFHDGAVGEHINLRLTVDFIKSILSASSAAEQASPSYIKIKKFLDRVQSDSRSFDLEAPSSDHPQIKMVFLTPSSRKNIIDQIDEHWPSRQSRPQDAFVVSPFYEPPGDSNLPAEKLWSILRQRGESYIDFVISGYRDIGDKKVILSGPESLVKSQPERGSTALAVSMYEAGKNEFRPLHTKSIWLQDDEWVCMTTGSSNFTVPGLGIMRPHARKNFEANVLINVNLRRNPKFHDYMSDTTASMARQVIDLATENVVWQATVDASETEHENIRLPLFFSVATFRSCGGTKPEIEMHFNGKFDGDWKLLTVADDPSSEFFSAREWNDQKSPGKIVLPWPQKSPPYEFVVIWANGRGFWPINIESANDLLPPEELRKLSLELLIEILVTARPLHEIIRRQLKERMAKGDVRVDLDPHKRVDVSTFLLQRTRRISWALTALRTKLCRPVSTIEALNWRLRGPAGVTAIKDAILREARSQEEKCFLLAELFGELKRVKPEGAKGCLDPEIVKKNIKEIRSDLKLEVEVWAKDIPTQLSAYISSVVGTK